MTDLEDLPLREYDHEFRASRSQSEASKRMLGDKAYDSAELREDLHERGTKPVIPNRCNRKQPFGALEDLDHYQAACAAS